jgi:hypothetical protein
MQYDISELWEEAIGLLDQARTDESVAQILSDGDPEQVAELLAESGLDANALQLLGEDLDHIQTDDELAIRFWFFIVKPCSHQAILPSEFPGQSGGHGGPGGPGGDPVTPE